MDHSAKDVGAFDAAPPPVGGLGNFKGVMLCNRPVDDHTAQNSGDGPKPFRSAAGPSPSEQLGLTPCRNFEPTVKKRGPSAALRRHVKWLKELQDQMREERDQVDEEEAQVKEREVRMRETVHQHRDGVRQMLKERNEAEAREEEIAKLKSRAEYEARKAAKAAKKAERTGQAPPPKPMWAMTEQEKEEFEEGEADELINFAENLDYDKFINDLEFRKGVAAMKDRAGKLKKESDAFKDALIADYNALHENEDEEERSTSAGDLEEGIDGHSLLGDQRLGSEYSTGSRRTRGEDRYGDDRREWDSSTNAGDEGPRVDRDVRNLADQVLESHTQMRGIHSKGSVQKIVQKARERQVAEPPPPQDLHELMLREGPAPVPVITNSEDTQNRLHKPPDPSLLPYLYRSPAI